ncbi:heterokaryon incompatibility protein-domain-containing protein [Cercophora newfieldiana]|uniref:Heterokaryon incompatibility protein-domain-containing protein n=1 Tax=Cercophora newfieldiana TaxID=92897 RepID=A0AA39YF84_9PEZI|nr:heterokaryon incompatibility protein-domain-containing protein [Cercophora newfieldiana]
MASRCQLCANLTITHLIELAQKEFKARIFPKEAYYKHHKSFDDLERSAEAGCDLCQLIYECFSGTPQDDGAGFMWPTKWKGRDLDVEESMCAAVKELDASDVKIAVDSSHAWTNDRFEDVRVFDMLIVQVGRSYLSTIDSDNESETETESFPELLLTFGIRDKEPVRHVSSVQVGRRREDPNLASPANYALARSWLETCRASHLKCLSNKPPELPTRVVDVGLSENYTPRLVLSQGRRSDYTALSHCWGGKIDVVLSSKTLRPFQEAGLPLADLAANFRDAIAISRELGIRYLWIDSLCIVQDSTEDWEQESRKMGRVYGDATLTISAIAASSSDIGLLVSGSASQLPASEFPAPIPLRIFPDRATAGEVLVERADVEEESLSRLVANGPLSVRGWTLQEAILSPRILYYGARQIYWECPSLYASADGLCLGYKAPEGSYPVLSSVLYMDRLLTSRPTSDRNALLTEYYTLTEEYSHRKLTFGSDKFPAFSGLARRLSPALGEYLAGIWAEDVMRGLLWRPEMGFCSHSNAQLGFRAPSWSWAVTDDRIIFQYKGDALAPSRLAQMKLLDWDIGPCDGGDPFGRLESGHLVVKGLTTPLIRSKQSVPRHVKPDGNIWFDNPESWQHNTPLPKRDGYATLICTTSDGGETIHMLSMQDSVPVSFDEKPEEEFHIDGGAFSETEYVLFLVHADDPEAEVGRQRAAKCLILRQVYCSDDDDGVEGTFERAGVALVSNPDERLLRGWEESVLKLV